MKLRRLTNVGIAKFNEYLDLLESEPTRPIPTWLLDYAEASEVYGKPTEIECRSFGSRFAAAAYLDTVLNEAGGTEVETDVGLWAWLTLFYFDEVCPKNANRERFPGHRARYIAEATNWRKYYRHLLAGPLRIYRSHKKEPQQALVVLCQKLDKPGDAVEQIASRQELITNSSVMCIATRLYVDPETKRLKSGTQSKGSGGILRFISVLNQFDVTWDLYATLPTEFTELLPKEFERFGPLKVSE